MDSECATAQATSLPYSPSQRVFKLAAPPLRESDPAIARFYKLSPNQETVSPCGRLAIKKELFLQRDAQAPLMLLELREFFTDDGRLIVAKSEDISAQVPTSGTYRATLWLPIPETAPAGRYRLVSTLYAEVAGKRRSIGTAQTSFSVLADPMVQSRPRGAATSKSRAPREMRE